MPTIQGTDHFNHAIDAGFYTDGFFGTPTGVTSPLYAAEANSLQIVSDGGNVGCRENISGTPTFGWMGFALRADNIISDVHICSFGVTGGAVVPALSFATDTIFATIGLDIGTNVPIATDTWYWIECIADVGGSTLRMHLRINGVDADPAETAGTGTTVLWSQQISFAGNPAGCTSWRAFWMWGTATSASDWLGEPTEFVPRPAMVSRGTSW